jgi:NADH-quinone oxidoreductase subunit L
MYYRPSDRAERAARGLGFLYRVSYHKFYLDEIYYNIVVRFGKFVAKFVDYFDRIVIDGIVQLVSKIVFVAGLGLKYTQTGQVQTYGVIALVGLFVFVVIAMITVGGVI